MITVTVKASARGEGTTTVALAIAQTLRQCGYEIVYENPQSHAADWLTRAQERIKAVRKIGTMERQRHVLVVDLRAETDWDWRTTYTPKEG